MKYDVEKSWFYSITERPHRLKGDDKYVLRIYFRKELKWQENMSYRVGDKTIENIIKKIKK